LNYDQQPKRLSTSQISFRKSSIVNFLNFIDDFRSMSFDLRSNHKQIAIFVLALVSLHMANQFFAVLLLLLSGHLCMAQKIFSVQYESQATKSFMLRPPR